MLVNLSINRWNTRANDCGIIMIIMLMQKQDRYFLPAEETWRSTKAYKEHEEKIRMAEQQQILVVASPSKKRQCFLAQSGLSFLINWANFCSQKIVPGKVFFPSPFFLKQKRFSSQVLPTDNPNKSSAHVSEIHHSSDYMTVDRPCTKLPDRMVLTPKSWS